jgi:hypothetical protein
MLKGEKYGKGCPVVFNQGVFNENQRYPFCSEVHYFFLLPTITLFVFS